MLLSVTYPTDEHVPQPRISMSKITEALRLKYDARLSHATIARATGLSKGVVTKYVGLAAAAGLDCWPLPDGVDEAALERRLFADTEPVPSAYLDPDWFDVHQELGAERVPRPRLVRRPPGAQGQGRDADAPVGLPELRSSAHG